MNKKVRLIDIASEAGVSVSAVSLVLNDKPCRISESTKMIIKKIASKHNYTPNYIAKSLVTKQSKTFGLVVPDIQNIFFAKLIYSVEKYSRELDYLLYTVNSDDSFTNEINLIKSLVSRGVDGLFIVMSREAFNHKEKMMELLNSLPVPFIMLDRAFYNEKCSIVTTDSAAGAFMAVEALIKNGHRRIACLKPPAELGSDQGRLKGYMDAMHHYGLDVTPDLLIDGNYKLECGYDAGESLYKSSTAAFISNDMMTIGVLKYFAEKGIELPKDYSLISYDNVIYPYLLNVELSSVAQNTDELGKTAVNYMMDLKDRAVAKTYFLKPELILRGSVGRLEDSL